MPLHPSRLPPVWTATPPTLTALLLQVYKRRKVQITDVVTSWEEDEQVKRQKLTEVVAAPGRACVGFVVVEGCLFARRRSAVHWWRSAASAELASSRSDTSRRSRVLLSRTWDAAGSY